MSIDRTHLNDALAHLIEVFHVDLDDKALDTFTHQVADLMEGKKRWTMPVLGDKLAKGHVLVGESGGESVIYETDPVDLVMGAMVVKTEHGSLYLDPHDCYDVRVETEPWWVYIERERPHRWNGGPNPDLALGPYPTEEDAEAALESSIVDGEMTSKDGGTDCYTVAQSAMRLGIGENVAELVHVFVDLDNPDHTGK